MRGGGGDILLFLSPATTAKIVTFRPFAALQEYRKRNARDSFAALFLGVRGAFRVLGKGINKSIIIFLHNVRYTAGITRGL